MSFSQLAQTEIQIVGVDQPLVKRYFQTFNAGHFDATANLFAAQGELHPPFEKPVLGNQAIAAYLHREAQGMNLVPERGFAETLDNGEVQVYVQGYVKTPLFGVNVGWLFLLNAEASQIHAVGVKLLASWEELAKLPR
ncbi:nuclear transport factor 2 family protein [Geitlerinema sp. PCC 9228]|jgi:acylphosphatase|uniref:nuclear transport factor 2 family protein n=1 Tax=Geitlerinema sp. PCC 9228 TaxID=111611 RepID=UPI0008F9CF3A|nr:nuclear transport factor 2 family protein [Geitlerinema sp. PCC 9228]